MPTRPPDAEKGSVDTTWRRPLRSTATARIALNRRPVRDRPGQPHVRHQVGGLRQPGHRGRLGDPRRRAEPAFRDFLDRGGFSRWGVAAEFVEPSVAGPRRRAGRSAAPPEVAFKAGWIWMSSRRMRVTSYVRSSKPTRTRCSVEGSSPTSTRRSVCARCARRRRLRSRRGRRSWRRRGAGPRSGASPTPADRPPRGHKTRTVIRLWSRRCPGPGLTPQRRPDRAPDPGGRLRKLTAERGPNPPMEIRTGSWQ
jgi:hypothetical protein